jgi:ribosome-binding factor A
MRHPSSPSSAAPTQRQLRVGEELRHALAAILMRGESRDPDLHDVSITVSEVRTSPDLKHATAFVTTLSGANMDKVLPALRRAAPWLRGQIARTVRLRFAPQLSFQADTAFDYAQKVDDLMHREEIARDLDSWRRRTGKPEDAEPGGDDHGA